MKYLSVAAARDRPALRLALSVGVPGPWGEGIKQILAYKKLPFLAVAQYPSEPNIDLVDWTGVRNAPVMVAADGRIASRWLDMILLAEQLQPFPAVLPIASADRAATFGLLNELCGEDGLGWCRRLLTIRAMGGIPDDDTPRTGTLWNTILLDYGATRTAADRATDRVIDILHMLADRLRAQRRLGSRFFVGRSLGAVDIYWACFSQMFRPLSHAVNPMSEEIRALYTSIDPEIAAAIDPILIAHRDNVFESYLGLPLDF